LLVCCAGRSRLAGVYLEAIALSVMPSGVLVAVARKLPGEPLYGDWLTLRSHVVGCMLQALGLLRPLPACVAGPPPGSPHTPQRGGLVGSKFGVRGSTAALKA